MHWEEKTIYLLSHTASLKDIRMKFHQPSDMQRPSVQDPPQLAESQPNDRLDPATNPMVT